MEYFRDPEYQVMADVAYRLGKIVCQYEKLNCEGKKYEVTLYIAVLQNLITYCRELIHAMTKRESKVSFFSHEIKLGAPVFGLSLNMVGKNTFSDENIKYKKVIEHIRNALCHPTALDIEAKYPSTGYTTSNVTEKISNIIFIDSPDTKDNNYKTISSKSSAEKAWNSLSEIEKKNINIKTEKRNGREVYILSQGEIPYTRIFRIEFTVYELREFIVELSNYLAQPIQEKWDGQSITKLVA